MHGRQDDLPMGELGIYTSAIGDELTINPVRNMLPLTADEETGLTDLEK